MAVYDLASYRPLPARKKQGVSQTRRRIAVVVNGGSRSGEAAFDAALDCLKTGGDVVSVEKAGDIDDFRDLVRQAARAADIVVVGGGDGSMSAALPFFLGDGPVLGVLPLGTANDLARTLGIPLDPAEAARIVADGQERRIDLGEVNGRPFCNAVSIGFAPAVAQHQEPDLKKALGLLHYPLCWFNAYREFRPFRAALRADGAERRFRRVFMLTVANGRHHGGGMTVDEDARIDDGTFDIYCLKRRGAARLAHAIYCLRRGKLREVNHATLMQATEVEITTPEPMPLDIDGEVLGETPARLRILPQAIRVMVPRETGDGLR